MKKNDLLSTDQLDRSRSIHKTTKCQYLYSSMGSLEQLSNSKKSQAHIKNKKIIPTHFSSSNKGHYNPDNTISDFAVLLFKRENYLEIYEVNNI